MYWNLKVVYWDPPFGLYTSVYTSEVILYTSRCVQQTHLYTFKCVQNMILYTSRCVHHFVHIQMCTNQSLYTFKCVQIIILYTSRCVQIRTQSILYTSVYTFKCVHCRQTMYTSRCVQVSQSPLKTISTQNPSKIVFRRFLKIWKYQLLLCCTASKNSKHS